MDSFFLIGVSFLTSAFTAIIGVGGGIALISVMPGLLPVAAIIPIHGAVQLASNASRVFFGFRHIEWRIFWPFAGGAVLGAVAGAQVMGGFRFDDLPLYLGVFILLVVWIPVPKRAFRLPGHFALFGALQTFLALFVGVAGPLTGVFLASAGLPKDRLVITHGMVMVVTHLCKILVFGFVGFAFAPYLPLIAGMIGAAALGSWSGTRLRDRVSESLFRKVFRGVITILSLRMIAEAL